MTTAKQAEKRTRNRRAAERRQTDLAIAGKDRRVAERRAPGDRRG
jgi:hypothetical protein